MPAHTEATRLVFLGPPGAGKGTQAARLAERLGVLHLATGDMLRQAVAENSALGQRAKAIMDRGDLVPDALVVDMLMEKIGCERVSGFVLDGFPRTLPQAQALDERLGTGGVDAVVLLDVPQAELVRRLLQRGRSDDSEATVSNRLNVYAKQTEPLVRFYEGRGLVVRVDGVGSVDEVARRVAERLS